METYGGKQSLFFHSLRRNILFPWASNASIIIDGINAVKCVKRVQSIMGIVLDESNIYDELLLYNWKSCMVAIFYWHNDLYPWIFDFIRVVVFNVSNIKVKLIQVTTCLILKVVIFPNSCYTNKL